MKIVKPRKLAVAGLFLVFISAMIFSCSNQSDLVKHIPKDAGVVMAFDMKSMGLKSIDFKQMLTFENIRKALGSLAEADSASNSLENSGIDFLAKAYAFGKFSNQAKYGAVVAALSDSKKFEEFIKSTDPDVSITQEGDYKLALSSDQSYTIGWNDKEVILLFGGENPKETMLFLANLKNEESLASNSETFSAVEAKAADISLWMNFEEFQKLVPEYSAQAASMNLSETFLTATCNFEDGQVVIDSKYITNDEMAEKISFMKTNVNKEIASALPGQTLIGMLGFALDMDKLYTYMEEQKLVDAYGGSTSQMTGLTVQEFLTMFSGDLAVTLNGVEMVDVKRINWATGEEVVKKEPEFNYCLVMGIANKERASKVLNQFAESGMLTKNEGYYSFQDAVYVVERDNALIVTGKESTKQSAIEGNGEKLNDELMNMLTTNATSLYVNPGNVPEEIYAMSSPLFGNSSSTASELQDVVFTSSTIKDNVTDSKLLIRFKTKSENSLVTISRMSKKLSEEWTKSMPVAREDEGQEVVEVMN